MTNKFDTLGNDYKTHPQPLGRAETGLRGGELLTSYVSRIYKIINR